MRAAIFRAITMIPGTRVLGTAHDHIGRAGIGVTLPEPGAVADWQVYLESKFVAAIPPGGRPR